MAQVGANVAGKPRFSQTRASVFLDLIRGIAALIVLFGHWRYLLFVDYPQLSTSRSLFALPYLIASCGHQAVIVFFVLSGYLVGGSVLRMFASDTWSWRNYMTHRLVRLWIVLIPGLALCYVFDTIGLRSGLAPLLYGGHTGTHLLDDVATRRSLGIAMQNLFFLQTIRAPTFGSDGALWSLANEFWYYILFPFGLMVVYPRRTLLTRALGVLGFAAAAWFCGGNILYSFPLWLFGAALALMRAPALSPNIRWVAAASFTLLFLLCGRLARVSDIAVAYLLAVGTTLFLWIILSAKDPLRHSAGEHFSRRLSGFSFTLYVVHTPLCVLLTALLAGDNRWQPTPGRLLEGAAVLAFVIGCTYGLAVLTEFHTDQVRRSIEPHIARSLSFVSRT